MSVSNLAKRRGKVLDDIMRYYREQLPKVMAETPIEDLRAFASVAPPTTNLTALLRQPGLRLIATCQKASPMRGLLVNQYDAARRAAALVQAGAAAVAVWTDSRHYQGRLEDLRDVRETLPARVPVIRQDFVFDPYQVYESRVAGADGVVLLTAVLGKNDLHALAALCQKLEMTPILDAHTPEEAALAVEVAAQVETAVIALNRRNWQTYEVQPNRAAELRERLPETAVVILRGGYDTPDAIRQARPLRPNAILIGEALSRSKAPDLLLKEMVRVVGK